MSASPPAHCCVWFHVCNFVKTSFPSPSIESSRMASLTMHRVRACLYLFVLVAFAAASILLQFYNPSLFNPNFFLHSKPRHEWRQYHLPPLTQPLSADMSEIRQAAADAWSAYAATGMTGDDLRPIQGGAVDHMHVHATLYDSLGTLYVMGLYTEFEAAVERAVALGAPRTLLFPTSSFEYNIRIIGGLLSAAQLSGDSRLLSLASDAAHTLLSSAYFLWPSPLMVGRVRMQPLTFRNFPLWLTARIMDATWMLWQRASQDPSFNYLAKVKTTCRQLLVCFNPCYEFMCRCECAHHNDARGSNPELIVALFDISSGRHLFSGISRSFFSSWQPHTCMHL